MAATADRPPDAATPAGSPGPRELRRPNLSGDLPRTLTHAPVFRRAVVGGYDRFQVDAYVQWAEDELASAGRQRADLVAHLAGTRAELDEARRLLAHSPAGAEFLGLSRRIGVLLATAADQADGLRADGEAAHAAASARAHRIVDDALAEAGRLVAEANAEAGRVAAEAARLLDEAEEAVREAAAEAAARVAKAQAIELRAREEAERLRATAAADAAAARQQARADVVRLLEAGREQRRRSEEEAAARRAALEAELSVLERRRATAGPAVPPEAVPEPRETPAAARGSRHPRTARELLHLGRRHAS